MSAGKRHVRPRVSGIVADAGCEYAVVVTMPATASERNVVRARFRGAYTKAAFQRPLPA